MPDPIGVSCGNLGQLDWPPAVALLGALGLFTVFSAVQWFRLPVCDPAAATVAAPIEEVGIDWIALNGFEPTRDLPSDLRGQRRGSQVRETCEQKSYAWTTDEGFPLGAFDSLTIHRMPDGVVADEWFPKFHTGTLHHEVEISTEHRQNAGWDAITAHHTPGSCVIVTVRWNETVGLLAIRHQVRHQIVRDLIEQTSEAICS